MGIIELGIIAVGGAYIYKERKNKKLQRAQAMGMTGPTGAAPYPGAPYGGTARSGGDDFMAPPPPQSRPQQEAPFDSITKDVQKYYNKARKFVNEQNQKSKNNRNADYSRGVNPNQDYNNYIYQNPNGGSQYMINNDRSIGPPDYADRSYYYDEDRQQWLAGQPQQNAPLRSQEEKSTYRPTEVREI